MRFEQVVCIAVQILPTVERACRNGRNPVKSAIAQRSKPCKGLVFGSGRGAVWLARLNGVQEVAGSNPVAPTFKARRNVELRRALFIALPSFVADFVAGWAFRGSFRQQSDNRQ